MSAGGAPALGPAQVAEQPSTAREHRARPIDEYLDTIEELVARGRSKMSGRSWEQRR